MSESKKKAISYKKCFCFNGENSSCGPFNHWNEDGVYKVDELNADISNHVQMLKVFFGF